MQTIEYDWNLIDYSGVAQNDYFRFSVKKRFTRFVIIEATIRVNGAGDFYFKIKVPQFNELWGWLPSIYFINNATSTVFLTKTCYLQIDQDGNDYTTFVVKGKTDTDQISVIRFWAMGY